MDKIVDLLLALYGPMPYFLIFGILLICGLGLPIPEDITLFAAGLSAYYGLTQLWLIIVVSYVGVLFGDFVIFTLGARYGRRITRRWIFQKLLPADRLNSVQKEFHKRGNRLIFAARFMPGLRAPIFFSAGTLHLPYRIFLFYDGFAALISVPVIISAVYYFGDELDHVVRVIQRVEHSIVLVIFLVVLEMLGKWYITHRKLKRGRGR
jgi:membrane protein DedA with SNARE-associated domain